MPFSDAVKEALGSYVYSLIDPREEPGLQSHFYIGKGKGDRVFAHLSQDLSGPTEMRNKYERIEAIRRSGVEPTFAIIAHGLTEKDALRLEAQLIAVMDGLTNLAGGHYGQDYWLNGQQIEQRYGQPIPEDDLPGPTLFVSLNGKKKEGLPPYTDIAEDEDELRRRSLGAWNVRKNVGRIEYVVGCFRGLARCVYQVRPENMVHIPRQAPDQHNRVRWSDGSRAEHIEEKLKDRTVESCNGKVLTTFVRGRAWNLSLGPHG